MKRISWITIFASLLLVTGLARAEEGFKVIVNKGIAVDTLSKSKASALFMKKTTKWDSGEKVAPVDQKTDAEARGDFSKAVHGKSASAVANYWKQQIFSGRGVPPPIKGSDADVVAYVKANAGAIGYVSAAAATDDVKVISISD